MGTKDDYENMGGVAAARKICEEGIVNLRKIIEDLEKRSPWETDAGTIVAAQLGYARWQLNNLEGHLARAEATD